MIGDRERRTTAHSIFVGRTMRNRMFPSEIFDEHAWNILLILFVGLADNETISERSLVERAGTSVSVGRRWIAHLVKNKQICERSDDDDVLLTPAAIANMREYLDNLVKNTQEAIRLSR